MSRREIAAKVVCYSIAVFLLVNAAFRETFAETILILLGCSCWYALGRLSFIWVDKLPKKEDTDAVRDS